MNDAIFNLVEFTNRSIFLTGKAGTGKTTFLNEFVKKTEKKHIVVAPTGIAAINAGGVTLHSMFGLPLRPFVPTLERIDQNLANNIPDLRSHFRYRNDKKKLLREVEIIIIDEVSMLRADVMDMMDLALRNVRRSKERFGGVQMLFIGDLQQLPPVMRDENILRNYYNSPFFFDSLALKDFNLLTIELKKVYRQKDEKFLEILNHIREGNIKEIDFEELNKRYQPNFEPGKESFVYLTSHNKMADEINLNKLKELKGKSFFYQASITGEYKENQYPNSEVIELKKGCQIMFIRNDASEEHRYFNGKLAEVTSLDEEEIWVKIDGDTEEYKLKREVWENKKYSLDAEKNIKEERLGSFEQFPIRLAWAVTIHKSQGLTFDRLIIDAGKSFTAGQVYVALSRCRTLEGIVLKSKITPGIIFNEERVGNFQEKTYANDRIEGIYENEKYDYALQKVFRKTDCTWILPAIEQWYSYSLTSRNIKKPTIIPLYNSLKKEAENLSEIYSKFQKVLVQKKEKFLIKQDSWESIEEKSKGAVQYFFEKTDQNIFQPLKELYSETKGIKGMKLYNADFKAFLDDLKDYLDDVQNLKLFEKPLFIGEKKQEVSLAIKKIPSHILSFQMLENGMSVSEIARERGLVIETIFGHLTKFADQGVLDIEKVVSKEKITAFKKLFDTHPKFESLTDWKQVLPEEFQFYEIRILLSYYRYFSEKNRL